LLVWGEDMKKQATSMMNINPKNVVIVGSPYFDWIPEYRKNLAITNMKMQRNKDSLTILFAGTSIPYDELKVLNKLDKLITKDNLKIKILYKPHPRAWNRKQSKVNIYKNITFYNKQELLLEDFLYFDGLISPFSSMMLEFALFNKPSLGIFYNDKLNDWPTEELVNVKHIKPILKFKWFTYCLEEEKFKSALMKFINIINTVDNDIISKDLKQIIYYEKNTNINFRMIKFFDKQIN